MKAVILTAGEGKRLEPLTNVRPKPMIPLGNRPLLDHVLQAVVDAGIEEVVLVVGYKRDRIQSYFGDGEDWGIDIEYVVQEKQLGTGDAVLRVADVIDDEFLVLNGDRVIDSSILERAKAARTQSGDAVMAVTHADEPELYGVVDLDSEAYVRDIVEKPETHEITSDLINAGVYAFGPEIFPAIRETTAHGELELTDVLRSHLEDIPIQAIPYDGPWMDVSRPWDLIGVNAALIHEADQDLSSANVDSSAVVADSVVVGSDTTIYPNSTILRGTAIGDNVSIGPNVTIQNSLIMSDTTIQSGSVIADAIVAENVNVGPNTTIPGGDADVVLQDDIFRDVKFGGMIGDNATLESSVVVDPGTFVGNSTVVEHGARVQDWIEPGTNVLRG